MYSFENESPNWLPGREPEPLARRLADLFRQLDSRFGGKCIIWEQWDHKAWDSEAVSLCRELGYSRGAAFLTAYGYGVSVGGSLISAPPAPPVENTASPTPPVETTRVSASSKEKLLVPPASAEKTPASGLRENAGEDPGVFYTGSVTAILPYNNSGFVRRDLGGDYYFNIRDFAHHVELRPGLKVRFRLERRMDHKHHRMRLNAVELSVIALDPQQQDADGRQIHHGPQTIKTPED